jgi:hypothetical protein
METGTPSSGKKQKTKNKKQKNKKKKRKGNLFLFLVVCDANRHVLWWFSVLSVMAGEVAAAIKKKKKSG